jgi:hypothetical protein
LERLLHGTGSVHDWLQTQRRRQLHW